MPYQEIDDQGNPVLDDEGKANVIEDPGSWDLIKANIPEDLREEKLWDNVPDTPTLLKNYAHAQKFQGAAVRVPDEEAAPEEWDEFYAKLGRPEKAEDYSPNLAEITGGWNEEMVGNFKQESHKLGLTPKQVQGVLDFYGLTIDGIVRGEQREKQASRMEAETKLREKYGAMYDRKIAVAKAAIEKYANEDLVQRFEETGLGNDPNMIEMLAEVGDLLQEDGFITGHVEGITSPEAAKEELSKIRGDIEGPYWDVNHPEHEEAVKKVQRLYQLTNPQPKE